MKRLLLSVAVMLAQVAFTDSLYYTRVLKSFPLAEVFAIGLPCVGGFIAQGAALGAWSAGRQGVARAGRAIAAFVLAVFGFSVSMLIALNVWGS